MTLALDLRPQIEAGGMADLPDVMLVMSDGFDPEFGEAWTEAQCAGVLGLPGCSLLLAREHDAPAGFAMLRSVGAESELLLIAVRPGYRRRGIASSLLRRAMHEARAAGIDTLHLEVRDGNPAIELYRAAAFVQVGKRPQYYRGRSGKVFDALTLKLNLEAI